MMSLEMIITSAMNQHTTLSALLQALSFNGKLYRGGGRFGEGLLVRRVKGAMRKDNALRSV